jgi:hypothetical protein
VENGGFNVVTLPYLNVNYVQQNIVAKHGTGSSYYGGTPNYKVFTNDQLRVMVDVICEVMQGYMSTFGTNVQLAIKEATPTPDQIHKLFLDKLMEHS